MIYEFFKIKEFLHILESVTDTYRNESCNSFIVTHTKFSVNGAIYASDLKKFAGFEHTNCKFWNHS